MSIRDTLFFVVGIASGMLAIYLIGVWMMFHLMASGVPI